MNKLFSVAIVFAALFGLCACEHDGETVNDSGIILYESVVEVGPDATQSMFNYAIKEPIEGVELRVECSEDWITIDKIAKSVVAFSVTQNDEEGREAKLNLSYGEERNTITIRQKGYQSPLSLTIESVDATSVTFSVAALDESITWIGQIVGYEWFESYTMEEIFDEDMSYYNGMASELGISLEEYLSTLLSKGSHKDIRMDGLDPNSEYVAYVYGILPSGEMTTRLTYKVFKTEPPYEGNDVSYDIDVEVNRAIATVSITPSHPGVAYFNNLITREDFEKYGNDINKAADAVIAKIIEDYAAWDYTLAETFEYNTDYFATQYEFEAMANTEYVAFAFKWNEKCERLSEVSYEWFTVGTIPPSDNELSMTISDVTQSTFYVDIKTTNDDPYAIIAIPSAQIANMQEDSEIFDFVLKEYGTSFLYDYIFNGDIEGEFSGMEAGTEYAVLLFGYEAGVLTTKITRENIKTLKAGAIDACKYDIVISNIEDREAYVTITPTDYSIWYYWNVFEADTTEEEVKAYIQNLYDKTYYGDYWEFSYYEIARGAVSSRLSQLKPSTEYKIVIYPMDPDKFAYTGSMREGGKFTTTEAVVADITITAGFDAYYDGDEVYAIEPEYCSSWKGWVVVPMSVNIEGNYSHFLYTMFSYVEDLENPEVYSDDIILDNLYNVGAYWTPAYFRGEWDKTIMIAAVAFDAEDNPSPVYRSVHTFTRDGAGDAQEFVDSYVGDTTRGTLFDRGSELDVTSLVIANTETPCKSNVSKVSTKRILPAFAR